MRIFGNMSKFTTLHLGLAFVMVASISAVALFQKQRIVTNVKPGTTITAEFSAAHRLRNFVSDAKISGVSVGVVTSSKLKKDGNTEITIKVKDDAIEKMGTAPSAQIRPTTLLGGNYYLEIIPGGRRGEFSGTIPLERTSLPVELDAVAATFNKDARHGVRSSISDLSESLDNGGTDELRGLVETAPGTLEPTTGAMRGLLGTRPKTDLRTLVGGMESTSRILSERNGQLDSTVQNLAATSKVLADRSEDMAIATASMPQTLDQTEDLMVRLRRTLGKLERTAGPARPSVTELNEMLIKADPAVVKARPVVRDLRVLLPDLKPTIDGLVPTSRDLTASLNIVNGPVLDRVNGPILKQINSPWSGTGRYKGGGADRLLYKELGYMLSNLTQANMADANGAMVSFYPGVGPGSLSGLPISLEQLFNAVANEEGAP